MSMDAAHLPPPEPSGPRYDAGRFAADLLQAALAAEPETNAPWDQNRATLPRPFGPYELIEEIGRGGMGVVYRARQSTLDRIVAVKLLLAGPYCSEASLQRFQIEAKAAAAQQHPGIVAIHDSGERDGQPYLVMDLIRGRNLAEVCAGRPLEARRAAAILVSIAHAVQHAHEHGILHRDLKPSNVLLSRGDHIHITDFGLAQRIGDTNPVTLTGQMLGSPSYVSPEQAAGNHAKIGVGSDVYGLGALLYHLLTGRAPFIAASAAATLKLVLDTEAPPPRLLNPALPRDLETICLKCLAKEPGQRYASAEAMAEDLERYLEHQPIRARPPGIVNRLAKFAHRHRVGVAASAAVLLALVAGLLVALAGLRRAVAAQHATDLARTQAEELVGLVASDLDQGLKDRIGLKLRRDSIAATIRYYESLPRALRDMQTEQRHAAALDSLAEILKAMGEKSRAEKAAGDALALRRQIAAQRPADADAAFALIRQEYSLLVITDDPTALNDETVWQGYIERCRHLLARFPLSFRVKQGLALFLTEFAKPAGNPWSRMYRPQAAMAAATEARTLVDELVGTYPDRDELTSLKWLNRQVLASVLVHAGENEQALIMDQEALALAETRWRADPGNLTLRARVAFSARDLAEVIELLSLQRAVPVERAAREHFRLLRELDPTNQTWAYEYAMAHRIECYSIAFVDGSIQPARRAFQHWDALLEPFKDSEAVGFHRTWLCTYLAILAAREGDLADARIQFTEAQARFTQYFRHLPDNPLSRQTAQIDFLQYLGASAYFMRDWGELENLMREKIHLVDAALQDRPADPEMLLNRPIGLALLGQSLLRNGWTEEARLTLEQALREFNGATPVPKLVMADYVCTIAREALAEILISQGEIAEARHLLELAQKAGEARMEKEPGRWEAKETLALTLIKLAGTYLPADPTEVTLRTELHDRAALMLDSPDAVGRITVAGKAARAYLLKLRGRPN